MSRYTFNTRSSAIKLTRQSDFARYAPFPIERANFRGTPIARYALATRPEVTVWVNVAPIG
jgi:hypothetical protein